MKKFLLMFLILILISTSIVSASETNEENTNVSSNLINEQNPIIPNAKVAYSVGKILLEKRLGRILEYKTEKGTYYLSVKYREPYNMWIITQECEMKYGGYGGSTIGTPAIFLDKTTGEVKKIYEVTLLPSWDLYGIPISDYYFIKHIKNNNLDISRFGYSSFE